MWLKIIIIIMLILIAGSLFSALYYLMKSDKQDARMLKALTWRISLSIGLFVLLMIGFYSGYIGFRPSP